MKNSVQIRRSLGLVLLGRRTRMIEAGIKATQDYIADSAGVSTRYYGQMERGEVMPSLYIIMRIAAALGMSSSDIIKQIEQV